MDWYIGALKKYAVFEGRARRKEYWMFVLFNVLIGFALRVAEAVSGAFSSSNQYVLASLYSLAVLLPTAALGVRRLHDTGRSGWWMLIIFIPLVNLILLAFYIQEGQRGPNQYGPDPKGGLDATSSGQAQAGWFADPTGRHELRYWDSSAWTSHVSDAGVTATDPPQ